MNKCFEGIDKLSFKSVPYLVPGKKHHNNEEGEEGDKENQIIDRLEIHGMYSSMGELIKFPSAI